MHRSRGEVTCSTARSQRMRAFSSSARGACLGRSSRSIFDAPRPRRRQKSSIAVSAELA
ncbi:MAG: hypothetical protein ACRDOH_33815 [Streptosporangiaceae bacterium]